MNRLMSSHTLFSLFFGFKFFWKILHIPAYPELLKSSRSACDKAVNRIQSLVRWLVLLRNQKWWKTATGGKLRNTSSLLCRERNLNTNIIIFNLHGNSIKTSVPMKNRPTQKFSGLLQAWWGIFLYCCDVFSFSENKEERLCVICLFSLSSGKINVQRLWYSLIADSEVILNTSVRLQPQKTDAPWTSRCLVASDLGCCCGIVLFLLKVVFFLITPIKATSQTASVT